MPEGERSPLDHEGVCSLCRKHETLRIPQAAQQKYSIEALVEKIERSKKSTPGGYDCAVSISGGKDSIMVLYVARERLGLNPLGIFIDNGFSTQELYTNAMNASETLGVNLVVFKTDLYRRLFKFILQTRKPFYFCRLCHALIDKMVQDVADRFGITLVLGGFTKGQDFLKLPELFWIFKATDDFIAEELSAKPEFSIVAEMFPNLAKYFSDRYSHIQKLSPFWYMEWNEDEIIRTITEKAGFKTPTLSWPIRSSNCLFNFLSQHLAMHHFGYSQHEPELSTLVRKGEMTRERALEIVNTPITEQQIKMVLDIVGLSYEDIVDQPCAPVAGTCGG